MQQINGLPGKRPLLLTVPGIDNSGPRHWQSLWEAELEDCRRVELGMWDRPHRNSWVTRLNAAIADAGRPVILIAHSLGCHAIAWWNMLERQPEGQVLGALLVAPPSLIGTPRDERLAAFAPTPSERLRFPAILAASHDDPYASFGQSRKMARQWGCRFVDAGWLGHINADSGIGSWPFGQYLVERLLFNLAWPRENPALAGAHRPLRSSDLRLSLD